MAVAAFARGGAVDGWRNEADDLHRYAGAGHLSARRRACGRGVPHLRGPGDDQGRPLRQAGRDLRARKRGEPGATGTISGGVHATNAASVQIHFSKGNGDVNLVGGRPLRGPFDITWNTIEDSVINGMVNSDGYNGFWPGFCRRRPSSGATAARRLPSSIATATRCRPNAIHGTLSCTGNDTGHRRRATTKEGRTPSTAAAGVDRAVIYSEDNEVNCEDVNLIS